MDAVPALGARRPRGDAAGAGGGLRAVRQRRPESPALHREPDRAADGTVLWQAPPPPGRAGARPRGGIPDHVDASVGGGWRHRSCAAQDGRAGTGGRARRARPTTAPTSGSSATRRPSVAGFWFGYDSPRPIASNASGGRLAAPAWATFYLNGWRERSPAGAWSPPAGLVQRTIDASNGELANEWCPDTQREWFKPGTEPTGHLPDARCAVHRPARGARPQDR